MNQPTARIIKSLLLSILSGILLALPYWNGKLWILAWFGFIPLLFAIQNKNCLSTFFISYLSGIIFWSITIYWLIHVTLLGQVLLILYLALYLGLFGFVISYKPCLPAGRHKLSPPQADPCPSGRRAPSAETISLLFIPSLWVLLEYLRSHLLTGFGWALLGYSQYLNLPVIQIADLFGVYGVSFLVMMVNVGIYSVIGYRLSVIGAKQKCLLPILCILATLTYGYYKMFRTPHSAQRTALKISLIQGNIPQELKWASGSQALILDRYARLTGLASQAQPDLIIWPEASNPGFLGESQDDRASQAIFTLVKKTKIPLLFGSVVREKEKYFNSALLINDRGAFLGRYDKLHLVPFGEYIPLKKFFPFLETIVPIGDFTAGKEYTIFQSPVKFAVLICFEDTIPELSRNFVKKGANFLVNITNDGWFKETPAARQHLAASVFRAIENRVPLARSANTGVSCFIDSRGRITAKLSENGKDIFVAGIKTGNVVLDKRKSPYLAVGDVFVLTCLAIVGFYGIIQNTKSK